MKKIILLILIIFVCGCTQKYKLEISNDKFKEEIDVNFNRSSVEAKKMPSVDGVETDDYITPFIENDQSALFSKESKYKKKVNYYDDIVNVNMKYTYNEDSFSDSNTLKLCFKNHEYRHDNSYYFHLYGEFYCLYADTLDIEIYTKNNVISENAHEKIGNSYIWHVTEDNVDDIEILFEVEKGTSTKFLKTILVVVVVISGISLIFYKLYKKGKINNTID